MVISTRREDILLDYAECLEQQIWPSDKVSELLNKMIQCGYINTVNRAYKIFMPVSSINITRNGGQKFLIVIGINILQDSILNLFFEFMMQTISYSEFKDSQQSLMEFKSQCSSLKSNVCIKLK